MKKGLIFSIGLLIGGSIGSVGTWYAVKTKYEQIAKKEIEEMRQVYMHENGDKSTSQNASVTHQNAPESILANSNEQMFDKTEKLLKKAPVKSAEKVDYSKILSKNDYDSGSKVTDKAELEAPVEEEEKPFIIDPVDFDYGEFEKISLNFYLDGVLTDDMDTPVDERELFGDLNVGEHFGDYEDEPDLVFVRDPKLKLDYEIAKRLVTYTSITGEPEYYME